MTLLHEWSDFTILNTIAATKGPLYASTNTALSDLPPTLISFYSISADGFPVNHHS